MRTKGSLLLLLIISFLSLSSGKKDIAFPDGRPKGGNFVRPEAGQILDVSPPGFSWWRAAPLGEVSYRLQVLNSDGKEIYTKEGLQDNVHVPEMVIPAGSYSWTVEVLDGNGEQHDSRTFGKFSITADAISSPWIPPAELLAKVPAGHPRLLFPKDQMEEIRATLKTTRKEAYEDLIQQADGYLGMGAPEEPQYDTIPDHPRRRLAYFASFQEMRRYHTGAMLHTSLAYLMTGKEAYGETAKTILLGASEWNPAGISAILAPYGDEVGLGLVKSEALTYDWIYDLLSDEERAKVEKMMVARADEMVERLRRQRFLSQPQGSHNGRLPGYLMEHAVILAEHPKAEGWMELGLKAMLTIHPHWAGRDGGWAEGLAYGNSYNLTYAPPLESVRIATGFNIWQRAFFSKSPYFFMYTISPLGEILGFGDSYNYPVPRRAGSLRSLLQLHAERMQSPDVRWWVSLLKDEEGKTPPLRAIPGLINPATVQPIKPEKLPNDRAFMGVGWAALHSDIANPEEDLLVLLKSSPYGGVSHSYNDQNSFEILCGGKVLARPGGMRWPHHGSPFHTRYSQTTKAQSSMLVNGEGQKRGGTPHVGEIVDFESLEQVGYVCGEAAPAYGEALDKWRRHVLLLRPSVICIIDDLEAPEPSDYQWLMHSNEKLILDHAGQSFTEKRGDLVMTAQTFSTIPLEFSQSNEWPVDPKTSYPESLENEPEKLWHFEAVTKRKARRFRMATIMTVQRPGGKKVDVEISRQGDEIITLEYDVPGSQTRLQINLDHGAAQILELQSRLSSGSTETLVKQ